MNRLKSFKFVCGFCFSVCRMQKTPLFLNETVLRLYFQTLLELVRVTDMEMACFVAVILLFVQEQKLLSVCALVSLPLRAYGRQNMFKPNYASTYKKFSTEESLIRMKIVRKSDACELPLEKSCISASLCATIGAKSAGNSSKRYCSSVRPYDACVQTHPCDPPI